MACLLVAAPSCVLPVRKDIDVLFANAGNAVRVAHGMSSPSVVRGPMAGEDGSQVTWHWCQVMQEPLGARAAFVHGSSESVPGLPGHYGCREDAESRLGVWNPVTDEMQVLVQSDMRLEVTWWYPQQNRFLFHSFYNEATGEERRLLHRHGGWFLASEMGDEWRIEAADPVEVRSPRTSDVCFPVWLVVERPELTKDPWLGPNGHWLFEFRRVGMFRNGIMLSAWNLSSMTRHDLMRLK